MTTKKLSDIELAIASVVRGELAKRRISANSFAGELGMSQPALSSKLRGATKFSVGELEVLAGRLGTSLSGIILQAEEDLASDPTAIFGLAADQRTSDGAERQVRDQELP